MDFKNGLFKEGIIMIYYTSDLHHSHKRITEFTERKHFTSSEEHNSWLKNIWNKQVTKHDTVVHLGDFSFASKYEEVKEFLEGLNGQKRMLKGNHDRSDILQKLKDKQVIQNWSHYEETKINEVSTVLFHFPILSWHKQGYGAFHLHGHCHGSLVQPFGKLLDVGLDSAYNLFGEHRFFTTEDIVEYMNNRNININDHHKEVT
jgi:calcineurin-like phosphoesterase family protein